MIKRSIFPTDNAMVASLNNQVVSLCIISLSEHVEILVFIAVRIKFGWPSEEVMIIFIFFETLTISQSIFQNFAQPKNSDF